MKEQAPLNVSFYVLLLLNGEILTWLAVIFDNDTNEFFFMEMNTRLQVEHPVTEEVTGEDLVAWQFKIAAGEPLPLDQETIARRISERGWAMEARIYAENPKENFMPDSGKLIHLRTPTLSDSVRIDAGFIEGDTISSAYDGMIAKLIVSGPTRKVTIQKLLAALQDYEVVGLNTNIEFLKHVCKSADFVKGEVETGYIEKHKEELFISDPVEFETFAQAALGLLAKELASHQSLAGPHGETVGFSAKNERQFSFLESSSKDPLATVTINQHGKNKFDLTVETAGGKRTYNDVLSHLKTPTLSTYFPHTRIESTVIKDENKITVFQHGRKTELTVAQPGWHEKALGLKESANSVLAPMPCKILRNEVKEGDEVEKDQALVV